MIEQNETFHTLPKTLNKKALDFYTKKEQVISKKNAILNALIAKMPWSLKSISKEYEISNALLIANELNGIQRQLEQAIGEKPAIIRKNVKLGYSLEQIHAYIHREMQKVVALQGENAISNGNGYGELFHLSNNIGIYIFESKLKKKDIQHFIDIIDSYPLNGYSGKEVLGIHGFDFMNDYRIKGAKPSENISRNASIVEQLAFGREDVSDNDLPIPLTTSNFEELYHQELGKLENKYRGMLSIGGKIHFPEAISEEHIETFQKKFGFASTPFKLIHANTSLLLPPSYFPEELALMIGFLQKEGLIEGHPQLQLSIPGRLPNRAAAMLGSCMLFSSQIHVEYTSDAFKTSHDSQTGSKIMAYGGGVLEKGFTGIPQYIVNDRTGKNDRTDMMGISDISLIPVYHLVGTLLCHGIYKGIYQKQGIQFMKEYKALLERYQLGYLLEREWVHIPEKYASPEELDLSAQEHYQTIKACTDKHLSDWQTYNSIGQQEGLLVFELEKLLNKYKNIMYYNSFLHFITNSCVKIIHLLKQ